jgi:hypothetical protein
MPFLEAKVGLSITFYKFAFLEPKMEDLKHMTNPYFAQMLCLSEAKIGGLSITYYT